MFFNSLICSFFFFQLEQKLTKKLYLARDINFMISNIHAVLTILNSAFLISGVIDVEFYLQLSCVTIGYALYDIYFLKITNSPNLQNLTIHHIILILCNVWINYYKDNYVVKVVAFNYLTEITTPLLNLSLYLYQSKQTDRKIWGINLFKL